MRVFRYGSDEIERREDACVTIGTYDGVHVGHQTILDRVMGNCTSTVITFDPHPQHVLRNKPGNVKILTPLPEKLRKLDLLGIDQTVVIPFNKAFAEIEPDVFLEDILIGTIGLKRLVVGFNHGFGKGRRGGIDFLHERAPKLDFELDVVGPQEMEGVTVSSTKIREALHDGRLETANEYLGRPYRIKGTVVRGRGKGHDFGYPTANLQPEHPMQLIPADGVYVVRVIYGTRIFDGVGSIGTLPTFGEHPRAIEAHLFDVKVDLYEQPIEIEWLSYLRPQEKFANADALIEQMRVDEMQARDFLSRAETV
ncbi:bifunctional riboflavin kinase/FAD synthetase [bacterium]|nr:bifunctional riboflavin kinase/FAD synthetase [bacterium]